MISRDEIQAFVNQVVERFRPSQVILFGSYAYGQPNADSAVDLMVVMPHRTSNVRLATRIRLACLRNFPMDLIVRSPAELRRRIKLGDPFFQEVASKGIVLHEAADAWMGRKSRSRLCRGFARAPQPKKIQQRYRLFSSATVRGKVP